MYDSASCFLRPAYNCPHPMHAGDLPPLFVNNGRAWFATITPQFTVSDVIGHTVIVHSDPDDFHTRPSGNSGEKIAYGMIKRVDENRAG